MKVFFALSVFCVNVFGTTAFFVQNPMEVGTALNAETFSGNQGVDAVPTNREIGGLKNRDPISRESLSARPRSKMARDLKSDVLVQGGSLKTWVFNSAERVSVKLGTEGRPLDADIELWHGPDNTPQKMKVYVEDGAVRPFHALLECARGPNTVAVRNIGHLEFPLAAKVEPTQDDFETAVEQTAPVTIQGGALRTFSYEPVVDSVIVMLRTDGRPLSARIELLQGPNNNKQVIELYTEDGLERPFYAVLPTPGSGNVIRIVNVAPMEFPLAAFVEPYEIGTEQQTQPEGYMIGNF